MYRIFLIHETRTEHAKTVRRQTGSNDFCDKSWTMRRLPYMQCIGTFLTADNLMASVYD